jgi:hypothetical protein
VAINNYLPETRNIIVPFTSLRTNIYQKCKTSEFQSLACVVHGNLKVELLVDPEGLLNTYVVTHQYVVECNPSTIPYPEREHFPSSADVYRRLCPRLSSMPRRMFEVCCAIISTSISILSKGAIKSLTNTRRVYVEREIYDVIDKGIKLLIKDLHVAVSKGDVLVTVSIRELCILANTEIQLSSTKYQDNNSGRKNRKFFHTHQQVTKLKR